MPGTRRKRSAAWKYFELVDGRAICRISHCKTELVWHGSTTALNAHLQAKHSSLMKVHLEKPLDGGETSSPLQQLSSEVISESKSALDICQSSQETSMASHSEIDKKICEWVANGPRHACVIEDQAFQDLIRFLAPTYKVPSATALAVMINSRYFAADSRLHQELIEATRSGKVALSVNFATECRKLIVLSAYYVTRSWSVQSLIIDSLAAETENGTESSSEAVAKWINDKLQEYGVLPNSVVAIVHSNDASIANGVSVIAEAYGWNTLLGCDSVLRSYVVEDLCSDPTIARALTEMGSALRYLCKSEVGKAVVGLAQKVDGSDSQKAVWESRRFFDAPSPTSNEFDGDLSLLHTLLKVLHPIDAALSFLKKDEFVSSSSIPILLSGLEKKLSSDIYRPSGTTLKEESSTKEKRLCSLQSQLPQTRFDDWAKTLKTRLLESLQNISVFTAKDVTTMSAVFDPRYKRLVFLSSAQRQALHSLISTECYFHHKNDKNDEDKDVGEPPSKVLAADSNIGSSTDSILYDILQLGAGIQEEEDNRNHSQEGLIDRIKTEMDSYFAEKNPASDVSPLDWWRANQKRFPMLAKMARQYLCIPATASVTSEQLSKTRIAAVCNHVPLCKSEKFLHFN